MVTWHPRQERLHLGLRKLFQQIPKQSGIQGEAGTTPPSLPAVSLCGLPSTENLADKADRDEYELLCRDNTRGSVDEYERCHLARVPSHAVVARSMGGKEDLIWELLNLAQVAPSTILPSCVGGPAWIWGTRLHSLLATVEVVGVQHSGNHATCPPLH